MIGKYYRHFKGNVYRVLHIAKHSETLEDIVVYQAMYGERGVWVRPRAMFEETIERDGKIFRRFEPVSTEEAEKSSDAKISAKVTHSEVSQRAKASDDALKVGQSVVMMDSDLRGKIVALGRKVKIELEDGLTIDAAYGEFAVTRDHELYALKQTKVKQKKTTSSPKPSATNGTNSLVVDLHIEAIPGGKSIPKGKELQFQMEMFRRVIRENQHHRGMSITFIHGIGDGILKAAMRKELNEVLALRCSYNVGDPAVTIVSIR
jgi:hypothetical protein